MTFTGGSAGITNTPISQACVARIAQTKSGCIATEDGTLIVSVVWEDGKWANTD